MTSREMLIERVKEETGLLPKTLLDLECQINKDVVLTNGQTKSAIDALNDLSKKIERMRITNLDLLTISTFVNSCRNPHLDSVSE